MYSLLRPKRRSFGRQSFSRRARIEVLEDRRVLSAPTVADVNIGSTAWTSSFVDYLETANLGADGYAIPVGSSSQLKTLPWDNLDQIRITFSENVDVQMGDLSVSGVNQTAYAFSDFSYDPNTYTAVWTLVTPFAKDKLLLDLDGDGIDPVQDSVGNVLDGEWTDGSSTYNSGNGTAGGDFEFRFNVLPGDASQNGAVNYSDSYAVLMARGKEAGMTGYSIFHDIDGDGVVTTDDWYGVYFSMGHALPAGNPAGMTNDAPTTTGFAEVNVDEDAADVVLSLFDAFDDAEDEVENLAYSVVDNTNPALFSSVGVDTLNGQLTLAFAQNAFGSAELTVRAMDSGGLFVDTILSVIVAPVNDAPVITNFHVTEWQGCWVLSGNVTDVDDDLEGMVVTFGGILAGRNVETPVNGNGTFLIETDLEGVPSGLVSAQTVDPHGAPSNVAWCFVLVS
ncbi:MAG: hypothetical protein GX621_11200 [Pirellulaceae bacterium]|nr:hypothetical protein [Pirellulaceae bacterium]